MAAIKQVKSGIAAGANHGHIVTPRAVPAKPSHRKGVRYSSIYYHHSSGNDALANREFIPTGLDASIVPGH